MKFRVEISRGKLWVANQMQVNVPTLPHRVNVANVVTLHLAMSKQLHPVLWPYFFNHANCGKISKKSVTPNSFTYDCVKASLLFNPYVPTTKWKIPPTSHSKSQHLMPFLLHHGRVVFNVGRLFAVNTKPFSAAHIYFVARFRFSRAPFSLQNIARSCWLAME